MLQNQKTRLNRQKEVGFLFIYFFIFASTSVFVWSGADAGLLAVEVQLIPTESDRIPLIILWSQDIYIPRQSGRLCVRGHDHLNTQRDSLLEIAVTKTKAEEIHQSSKSSIIYQLIGRGAAE